MNQFSSVQIPTPNQRPLIPIRPISDKVDSRASIGALATTRGYQPSAGWSTVQATSNPMTPVEPIGYGLVASGIGNFQVAKASPSIDHSVIGSGSVGVPVIPAAVQQNAQEAKQQAQVPQTADTSLDRVFFRNVNMRPDQASLYAEIVSENKNRVDIHSAMLRAGTLKDTMKYQQNKEVYASLYRHQLDELSSLVKQPKMTRVTVGYDKDGEILKKKLTRNPYVAVTRKQREGVLNTRVVRYNKPTDDQRQPPLRKEALEYSHPIKDDRATAAIEGDIEMKQLNAVVKKTYTQKLADAKKLRAQAAQGEAVISEFKKKGLIPLSQQNQSVLDAGAQSQMPALQSSTKLVAVNGGA